MRKNYILDANILLHDPQSVFQFADNTVVIPIGIIREIDRFKKEMTDRGHNARAVVRLLDSLRGERSLAEGVELKAGGSLRVHCDPSNPLSGGNGHGDTEVLLVAQMLQRAEPETPVIIVTKDINLRIRADAAGLRAEDYESGQVQLADLYTGHVEHEVPAAALDQFRSSGRMEIAAGSFLPNEYVLLRALDTPPSASRACAEGTAAKPQGRVKGKATALARVDAECKQLVSLKELDEGLWGIKPRNKEQYFAIDALLDERIQLVTIMGKAGTGKTLLAIAGAMHLTFKRRKYRGMLIARPIFPLGRDLGFLPGDIGQKLDPWMKPVVDTVDYLLDVGGAVKGHHEAAPLLASGLIEIQPLTYIRGRSIANRFVVIDEAQNLTPLEVKTVITRIGQDAKIVLTGDAYQIDNPYVDANSNGFTHVVNSFRSHSIAAHIELQRGERSPLAELAANLL